MGSPCFQVRDKPRRSYCSRSFAGVLVSSHCSFPEPGCCQQKPLIGGGRVTIDDLAHFPHYTTSHCPGKRQRMRSLLRSNKVGTHLLLHDHKPSLAMLAARGFHSRPVPLSSVSATSTSIGMPTFFTGTAPPLRA